MANKYKSDTPDIMFAAGDQRVSEKTNSPCDINRSIDLLPEIHRQLEQWITNCGETWVDPEDIEDLAMIKIMIEDWMNSNASQTINTRVH